MRAAVSFLAAVGALAPGAAQATCGTQIHLVGQDEALLKEVADALADTGLHVWSNANRSDELWGCLDHEVVLETQGRAIRVTATDPRGLTLARTVRSAATAVAWLESWLVTDFGAPLPGGLSPWALSVRAEGGPGNDYSWSIGLGATLRRSFGSLLEGAMTLRVAPGWMDVRVQHTAATAAAPRVAVELVAGGAATAHLDTMDVSLGVGVGARVLAGAFTNVVPLIEPALTLDVPLTGRLAAELRLSAQLMPPDGMLRPHEWASGRFGVGVRWSLW